MIFDSAGESGIRALLGEVTVKVVSDLSGGLEGGALSGEESAVW